MSKKMKERRYYVYMVLTANGNYYTGIAKDPQKRADEHNHCNKKGAKALRGQRPVTLVWQSREVRTRSEALRMENFLKGLSHQQKQQLVATGVIPMGEWS